MASFTVWCFASHSYVFIFFPSSPSYHTSLFALKQISSTFLVFTAFHFLPPPPPLAVIAQSCMITEEEKMSTASERPGGSCGPGGPGGSGPDQNLVEMHDLDAVSFLESRGLSAAPEAAFGHVEASLDSGVREDMIVEMPVASTAAEEGEKKNEPHFWLARILGVHGPLLRLSLVGAPEGAGHIWHDLTRSRLYPLGWCQMNRIEMSPPPQVKAACPGWEQMALQYLEDVSYETISMHHIDGEGVTPVDRIKPGMRMELRHEGSPDKFWPVEVKANQGGMLTVVHCVPKSMSVEDVEKKLFYISERLFPLRHAEANGKEYAPPDGLAGVVDKDAIGQILAESSAPVPSDILLSTSPPDHDASLGDLAEVLIPLSRKVRLGKVTRLWGRAFFEVTLLGEPKSFSFVCHSQTRNVFPLGWWKQFVESVGTSIEVEAEELLEEERGQEDPTFKSISLSPELPEKELDFEVGQKLEMFYRDRLRLATIVAFHRGVLGVELDSDEAEKVKFLLPANSQLIFPFMWGQTNGVPCIMPKSYLPAEQEPKEDEVKRDDKQQPEDKKNDSTEVDEEEGYWCPPIYFNYQCYSASFLSKARLASLPKSVGPGSVYLVMKKVLELIIGSSYKSASVLKRLECQEENLRRDFVLECLKGKSRVHNLKAKIEIPTRSSQVREFCREVCQKLGACPNLISSSLYSRECPARCQSRSTRSSDQLDDRRRKGGKKRRHHFQSLNREDSNSSSKVGSVKEADGKGGGGGGAGDNDEEDGSSSCDDSDETPLSNVQSRSASPDNGGSGGGGGGGGGEVDRHRTRRHGRREPDQGVQPARSRIMTRGAKLPDYKLHFKIRPTKEEQKVIESNSLRESIGYDRGAKRARYEEQQQGGAGAGAARRPGWMVEPAFRMSDLEQLLGGGDESGGSGNSLTNGIGHQPQDGVLPPIRVVRLSKNPEEWTCEDTAKFLAQTPDCAHLAHFMLEDEIDGLSFMLLNFPTVKAFWSLTVASAIRLCRHIESVKLAFYSQSSTAAATAAAATAAAATAAAATTATTTAAASNMFNHRQTFAS